MPKSTHKIIWLFSSDSIVFWLRVNNSFLKEKHGYTLYCLIANAGLKVVGDKRPHAHRDSENSDGLKWTNRVDIIKGHNSYL